MLRRKNLIDRKFQLKTTFRIIGIIIITFILVIAVTGIISTDNNRRISAAIADINRSVEKDKKTVAVLIETASLKTDTDADRRTDKIVEDHLEAMALMHTNIVSLKSILRKNLILVTVMIIAGVLLGCGLFAYLIRLTNRISGPLYVLTRHMSDIMEGRKPDLRELRKNDELQEFYSQFISFIDDRAKKT